MKTRSTTEIHRDIQDAVKRYVEVYHQGDDSLNFNDRMTGNTALKALDFLEKMIRNLYGEHEEATRHGEQLSLL